MLSKRARLWLGLIAATSLLSLASACGGGNTNTEGPTTEGKPLPVKGNEGTITGKISYTGAAPEPKKIDTPKIDTGKPDVAKPGPKKLDTKKIDVKKGSAVIPAPKAPAKKEAKP